MSNYNGWSDDIEIEQSPVATSSRPSSFVPALPARRPEPPTALWQPAPSATVDAWRPHESVRETTTATDRAWGYNIRLLPALLVCLLLAGMGTLAFILIMRYLETPTDAVTNLFAFLLFVGVGFLMFAVSLNRTDYRHSGSGIELERLSLAHDLESRKLQKDHELRQTVIGAYLKRLEGE